MSELSSRPGYQFTVNITLFRPGGEILINGINKFLGNLTIFWRVIYKGFATT